MVENKEISIDLNCDLAQSFGVYNKNSDIENNLLNYVSSVNVSCGFHAGDPISIKNALVSIKDKNLALGAHIGFDDIKGFGAKDMDLSKEEVEAIVLYQIGALSALAKKYGLEIEHVRPHGAMYKRAAVDLDFSLAIANAIKKFDKWIVYYGAASDILDKVSELTDVKVAHELHLNKIYKDDGLIDYNANDVSNLDFISTRLSNLLKTSEIRNKEGGLTKVKMDTIHLSSSSANIIEIAQRINETIGIAPVNYNRAKASGWI